MSESGIRPGAFVWYAPKGIGRVEETGGSLSVLFWIDRKSGKTERLPPNLLTPLAAYMPEAESPGKADEADPWKLFESGAKKAPLKLVALALSACGNSGETADIKEKLDRRAPVGPWGSWWKRTEPKLREMPSHFKIDGTGEDVKYTLLSSIADVPVDWIEPKVTLADWKKWLNAKTHEHPPGRFPTKPVADALAKWPEKTIDQALYRVMVTSEQLLASGDVSSQVAEGWLRAVAQASLRWREVADPDPRGYQAARIGSLLARLSRVAGDRTPQDLLLRAGELDGEADAWRRGFAAGMWEAFDGDDARDMYLKSSAVLRGQSRSGLAREMALAAFGPDYTEQRYPVLDRLLDALPENERHQLIMEMIVSSVNGPQDSIGILAYISESRHAAKSLDATERLGSLLMTTLLLTVGDTRGGIPAQTSRELAAAFTAPEEYSPSAQAIFRDTRARIAEERACIAGEMESLREAHATELERERREQERLRQQVRQRNADLAAKREESRLEARRDMLLAIGEVLQSLRGRNGKREVTGDVEAGLRLALKAGGAELFDNASEGFDPHLHQATEKLVDSTPVKVVAPGVIVPGKMHGDLVLLKAQVIREAS